MEIIIAIDLIDGKCVRLEQGDYNKKTNYYNDPLQVARILEENGLKRLHMVDLDGAKAGKIKNLNVLERIASNTNLEIDFGGGIKSDEDVQSVFNAGAKMVAIGSTAVKRPSKVLDWAEKFGNDKLFLGADVKNGKIATNGWLEESKVDIETLIADYTDNGIHNFFCTDISKDGMLAGPAIELYAALLNSFPTLKLTASGGVSNMNDVAALKRIGCDGVIIGKAFYENRITIDQLKNAL